MTRRAFGYVRVSTTEQADNGASLRSQIDLINAIAAVEGFELAGVYIDAGVSGSIALADRPEGAKLLASARKGDVIIAAKLDRAFRSVADASTMLASLKARGIGLYLKDMGGLIAGDSAAEFMFTVLASVATFERSRIKERIAEARVVHRANYRHLGGSAKFGYHLETRQVGDKPKQFLVRDEATFAAVSRLKAQGYSARLMIGALKADGIDVSRTALNKYIATNFAA